MNDKLFCNIIRRTVIPVYEGNGLPAMIVRILTDRMRRPRIP